MSDVFKTAVPTLDIDSTDFGLGDRRLRWEEIAGPRESSRRERYDRLLAEILHDVLDGFFVW